MNVQLTDIIDNLTRQIADYAKQNAILQAQVKVLQEELDKTRENKSEDK